MNGTSGQQHGVALVIVMWMIVLLTIIAGSFTLTMKRETTLVSSARSTAHAGALAEGGIYRAMLMLQLPDKDDQWRTDGTAYEFRLADGLVRVRIEDVSGKYSLNKATVEVLSTLFVSVGVETDAADAIAAAIADWRDSNDLTHLNGAEKRDYQNEGRNYGPTNKPFQAVEELRLVLGINYEIYQAVKHLVTVHSRNKQVDPAVASKEVLMTLPNVDEAMVDSFIEERLNNPAGVSSEHPLFQAGNATGSGSRSRKGRVFIIHAEGRAEQDAITAVEVTIVRQSKSAALPFSVVLWERFPVNDAGSMFNGDAIGSEVEAGDGKGFAL